MITVPKCTNPQHPAGRERTMLYLGFEHNCHLFACQACKDVNRKMSARAVTDANFRRGIRRDLAREGKLMTEAPKIVQPRMRQMKKPQIEWDGRKSRDGRYELVLYRNLPEGELQVQM